MPLPRVTERAARDIARLVAGFDDALDDYIVNGGRPPSWRTVLADIRPLLVAGVTAALEDGDVGEVPAGVIRDAVNAQLAVIQRGLVGAADDARRARRQVPRRLPEQDDGETVPVFVRRVGAVTAAVVLAKSGRRPVRVMAQRVGARLPRRQSPYVRMVHRTESAIARNTHVADVVEARQETLEPHDARIKVAVFVEDARKGPTDEACEDVNGKWATPAWLRAHPVEHPNCTRRGRPRRLPAGAVITLLS